MKRYRSIAKMLAASMAVTLVVGLAAEKTSAQVTTATFQDHISPDANYDPGMDFTWATSSNGGTNLYNSGNDPHVGSGGACCGSGNFSRGIARIPIRDDLVAAQGSTGGVPSAADAVAARMTLRDRGDAGTGLDIELWTTEPWDPAAPPMFSDQTPIAFLDSKFVTGGATNTWGSSAAFEAAADAALAGDGYMYIMVRRPDAGETSNDGLFAAFCDDGDPFLAGCTQEDSPIAEVDWQESAPDDGPRDVIPEPTTFVLAGFGLFGLACCGWRRRRRA